MSSSMPDNRQLVFIHIPKTAGTSMWDVIRNVYKENDFIRIMEGASADNIDKFYELINQSQPPTLIGGHFQLDFETISNPNFRIFTMLRNPVKRFISLYYKIMRSEGHTLYEKFTTEDITLEQSMTLMTDNLYVRKFASVPKERACTSDDLTTALHNINNYLDFVGITEYFDEAILMMKQRYDWQSYPYYSFGNEGRYKRHEISEQVKQLAAQANQFDIKLYDTLKQQFEENLTTMPLSFKLQLAYFQGMMKYQNTPVLGNILRRVR